MQTWGGIHTNCHKNFHTPSAAGSPFAFFDGGANVDAPLAAEDDADVGADSCRRRFDDDDEEELCKAVVVVTADGRRRRCEKEDERWDFESSPWLMPPPVLEWKLSRAAAEAPLSPPMLCDRCRPRSLRVRFDVDVDAGTLAFRFRVPPPDEDVDVVCDERRRDDAVPAL